jgi:hypothetical protein
MKECLDFMAPFVTSGWSLLGFGLLFILLLAEFDASMCD